MLYTTSSKIKTTQTPDRAGGGEPSKRGSAGKGKMREVVLALSGKKNQRLGHDRVPRIEHEGKPRHLWVQGRRRRRAEIESSYGRTVTLRIQAINHKKDGGQEQKRSRGYGV